jgi:hypothetical protein
MSNNVGMKFSVVTGNISFTANFVRIATPFVL